MAADSELENPQHIKISSLFPWIINIGFGSVLSHLNFNRSTNSAAIHHRVIGHRSYVCLRKQHWNWNCQPNDYTIYVWVLNPYKIPLSTLPDQRGVANEKQIQFVDCLLVLICVRTTRPPIRNRQNWETKNNCRTTNTNSSNNKLNKNLFILFPIFFFVCSFVALAFLLPVYYPRGYLKLSPDRMIKSFHVFITKDLVRRRNEHRQLLCALCALCTVKKVSKKE